jgi:predicted RNase H-like nuclease
MVEPGLIAGVDGCRGGWVAVLWHGPGHAAEYRLCPTFADVLALAAGAIAVDMPIGLPDTSGRDVEQAVRPLLGKRKASVFTVPARAASAASDYFEACAINRRHSQPPRAVSRQCFNLFEKIREIDALVTTGLQNRVFEAHPEVAFRMMSGETLTHPKKSLEGKAIRVSLLRKADFPIDALPARNYPHRQIGADDILDACALAWVARRIRDRESERFPARPKRDSRGLRMEING